MAAAAVVLNFLYYIVCRLGIINSPYPIFIRIHDHFSYEARITVSSVHMEIKNFQNVNF